MAFEPEQPTGHELDGAPGAVTDQHADPFLAAGTPSVSIAIPAYNEGAGIVATLASLWAGMGPLGLATAPIVLSDSSTDTSTVDAASQWARSSGAVLRIDRSTTRRSLKQALNAVLDQVDTDLLIVTVADVIVPPASLAALIEKLVNDPQPRVVVGVADADPAYRAWRYRAGAFQLRAVRQMVERNPPPMRAEGAFWGAWRDFYQTFRFPENSGSVADDIELWRAVAATGIPSATEPLAVVLKVPAGSPHDFALQLLRWHHASGYGAAASPHELIAKAWTFCRLAIDEPVGATLYATYAAYARLRRRSLAPETHTELWSPALSTKRTGSATPT